ncbi:MAG: protease PrsW [Thermoplasmata archaeon]|nr:MAG: protease PrsW [Thermoplasmata archaeon]HEC89909.1 protease PrsW [Thermoplasmatales archaeon]
MLPPAGIFLGLIPALIVLYIGLKGWEGYYKEKTVFILLVIGLIIGFIASIIEYLTVSAGLIVILLFPLLEQILKTIVLNISSLQEKQETTLYGLAIGLGFGSMFMPFSLLLINVKLDLTLLFLFIGSIGIILFHGATGILLGYGIYQSRLPRYFSIVILFHLPITIWFFLTTILNLEYLQVVLIFYGLIIYWYASKKFLKKVLLQVKSRRRVKRKQR